MVWRSPQVVHRLMCIRDASKVNTLGAKHKVAWDSLTFGGADEDARETSWGCASHQLPSSLRWYGVHLTQLLSCAPLESATELHLFTPALHLRCKPFGVLHMM